MKTGYAYQEKIFPLTTPLMPPTSPSLWHGMSFFETLVSIKNKTPLLNQHLARLFTGLDDINLSIDSVRIKKETLNLITLILNHCSDCILRITLFYHQDTWPHLGVLENPSVAVFFKEIDPKQTFSPRPIKVSSFENFTPTKIKCKSGQYLAYSLARKYSLEQGSNAAILVDQNQNIIDGDSFSILAKKNQQWLTPGHELTLPSISLAFLSMNLPELNICSQVISLEDLYHMDQVYYLKATSGVGQIIQLNKTSLTCNTHDFNLLQSLFLNLYEV